jgi:transposase-like protein
MWEMVMVSRKNVCSALAMQNILGVTYKTVWALFHKLRRAMVVPGRELLKGDVEVDETYFGGLEEGHRGRGAINKVLIILGVELKNDKGLLGRIRMNIIKSAHTTELLGFIKNNVAAGSKLVTDGWAGYSSVVSEGYTHEVKVVSKDKEALPHVHLVISLFKRWLLGTHQGAVSHEQLEYYLDEFVFRFNRRSSKNRILLFQRLLENGVRVNPTTIRNISKHSHPFYGAKNQK